MKSILSKFSIYKYALANIILVIGVFFFSVLVKSDPITDPSAPLSQQPTVKLDGTGIPKINITTPEAGVSHNKFKQFNVSPNGLILNNSKIGGTSRIGGAVVGNPNLKDSGSANVIINEVTGDTDSQLKGAIEVFGTRADVILANPNGVICNGCAFLNTGRATLTTGRPVVNGSQVDLHVTEGVVVVEGDGLSAPDGDAALVGRHVIIDGPVNARDEAYVSGGTQYHDHNQRKSRAAPVVNGRDVLFSVDASELGAMSAGQIRIHGNEAGLGVRAFGNLNSAGDIKIESAGDIAYRNANAAGKGIIRSNSDVTQYGNAIFGDTISIAAGSYLLPLNAKLSSEKDVEINTDGLTQIEGEVTGDNIRIEARGGLKNSGFIMADGDLEIISGEGLSNFRRKLGIYDVTYENRYARYAEWFKLTTYSDWQQRWADRFVNRAEGSEAIEEFVTQGGTISGRTVNITAAEELSNVGAVIAATEDLTINALGDISNSYVVLIKQDVGGNHKEYHPGEILAGRNLTITGEGDLSNQASHIGAYGDVVIDVKGHVTNYLTADKYVSTEYERLAEEFSTRTEVVMGSLKHSNHRYLATQNLIWKSESKYTWDTTSWKEISKTDENLILNPGKIVSLSGDLTVSAASYNAIGSELSAANNLNLNIDGDINLIQVVDQEKHIVDTITHESIDFTNATTYGFSHTSGWGFYNIWWYWATTAKSHIDRKITDHEESYKTIVAASNLFGKNISISADQLAAPGAKIFATEDLSIVTNKSLYLEGDTSRDTAPTGHDLAAITHFDEWDYLEFQEDVPDIERRELGDDKLASINADEDAKASYSNYLQSKQLLRALYALNKMTSGYDLKTAAKAVGIQEWAEGTSESDYEETINNGLVVGERNFAAALYNHYKTQEGATLIEDDSATADLLAGRFIHSETIARVSTNPYTVLSGRDVSIGSNEDVSLLGGTLIDARQDLKIVAGRDVLIASVRGREDGTADENAANYSVNGITELSPVSLAAGRDLSITAGDDIYNMGGSLYAEDSIVMNAVGDIMSEGLRSNFKLTAEHGCGYSACGRTGFRFTPADIVSKGSTLLVAGGSIFNRASDIISDGSIYLQAGEDVINEAKSGKFTHVDYYRRWVKRKWYGKKTVYEIRRFAETPVVRGSAIEAVNGDLLITAGQDLINFGGLLEAGGLLNATVGRDVLLNSIFVELANVNYSSKSSSWLGWNYGGKLNSAEWNQFKGATSAIQGRDVNITAGGDLIARGARIQSTDALNIVIDGNIAVLPVQNTLYNNIKTEKTGFFSSNSYSRVSQNTLTNPTELSSGADLLIQSTNKNIVIKAANLSAGGDLTLDAGQGQISLLTATETEVEKIERYKANAVWWTAVQEGFVSESILHNHLIAGGQIYFRAKNGVLVEYEANGDVNHAIAELSKAPELAWMAQLRVRNDVEWRAIQPHFEEWYEQQEGLTEGAAAVIALAVSAVTGPGGAAFLGVSGGAGLGVGSSLLTSAVTKSVVTVAIDAGFTAIASRAAVSLINNKGDIGAVLKELGSSESLRSIAASIITAGVSYGLDTKVFQQAKLNTPVAGFASIQQTLVKSAIKGTVNASIRVAIEGGDLGDSVQSAVISSVTQAALSVVQAEIGTFAKNNNLAEGSIDKILLHAGAGAISSALQGGNPLSGAVAGAISEIVSGSLGDLTDEQQIEVAKLVGGLAAFVTSGGNAQDVNIGAEIAGSAIAFNRQLHSAEAALIRENAAQFAVDQGWCPSTDICADSLVLRAQQQLTSQALRQVDSAFSSVKENTAARGFLTSLGQANASSSGLPTGQTLFYAEGAQYTNHVLNAEQIKSNLDLYSQVLLHNPELGRVVDAPTNALFTAARDKENIKKASESVVRSLFQTIEEEFTRQYPDRSFEQLHYELLPDITKKVADYLPLHLEEDQSKKSQNLMFALADGLRTAAYNQPDVLLEFAQRNPEQFDYLMSKMGVFDPSKVFTTALASKAGVSEQRVTELMVDAQATYARVIVGGVDNVRDQVTGLVQLSQLTSEEWKALGDVLYENPELIVTGAIQPFQERIAKGDYAGALGYALPAAGSIASLAKATVVVTQGTVQGAKISKDVIIASASTLKLKIGSAVEGIYSKIRPLNDEFPELVGVNPHFVENAVQGVNTNCVSCVNASVDRLTGRNVDAVASKSNGYGDRNDLRSSIPFGYESGGPKSVDYISKSLSDAGDGAYGVLEIATGPNVSHVILGVNRGGKVMFVDPQRGVVVDLAQGVKAEFGLP